MTRLRKKFVEPYLAQDLHWRMVTRNAQLTPRDQINGLLIGVVTCEVTVPTDANALPQYAANVVPRPAATTRKSEDWSGDQPEGRGDGTGFTGGNILILTSFDHYSPLVSVLLKCFIRNVDASQTLLYFYRITSGCTLIGVTEKLDLIRLYRAISKNQKLWL